MEAFIDAAVAEPGNAEAKLLLRNHASSTRDHAPLVEALIRIGEGAPSPERNACLRELGTLAEERLSDPGLANWAIERLLQAEPSSLDGGARALPELGKLDLELAELPAAQKNPLQGGLVAAIARQQSTQLAEHDAEPRSALRLPTQ